MARNLVVEFEQSQAEVGKIGHEVEYMTGDGTNVQVGKCTRCGRYIVIGYPNVNQCVGPCSGVMAESER